MDSYPWKFPYFTKGKNHNTMNIFNKITLMIPTTQSALFFTPIGMLVSYFVSGRVDAR